MKKFVQRMGKSHPIPFRIGLVFLYLLFHLLILRPVRTAIFSWQVPPDLIQQIDQDPRFSFRKLETRLFTIDYSDAHMQTFLRYKVPLGSFFFLGITGLILIGSSKKFYLLLILSHTLILLISWIIFALDIVTHPWLLYIPDFLSIYWAPLSALGVIPLSLMVKRGP